MRLKWILGIGLLVLLIGISTSLAIFFAFSGSRYIIVIEAVGRFDFLVALRVGATTLNFWQRTIYPSPF